MSRAMRLYLGTRYDLISFSSCDREYTRLNDRQVRNENRVHYQFNAALSVIIIAKSELWIRMPREQRKAFPATDKTMNHTALLLEGFPLMLELNPHLIKNQKQGKKVFTMALLPLNS